MPRFKNILLLTIFILTTVFISCSIRKNANKEDEWKTLFNGKNLDGWVPKIFHHKTGENYANTFRVVDGMIQVNYDGYKEFNQQYGHLFYKQPYSSYHLKFEYQFTDEWMKDAPSYTYRNSGVMFHSQDPYTILQEQDWPISVEYQILAEEKPGEARPTGNMCSPGTDVFYHNEKDKRHCIDSKSKTYKWNEWVSGELIVYQDSLIKHIVNGDTVLQYTKPQIGGGTANGYNPAIKIDGKALKSGYIALQAEGQGINFKNIKIKKLD